MDDLWFELWLSGKDVLTPRQDSLHIRLMFRASNPGIHDSAGPLQPTGSVQQIPIQPLEAGSTAAQTALSLFHDGARFLIDGHYTRQDVATTDAAL